MPGENSRPEGKFLPGKRESQQLFFSEAEFCVRLVTTRIDIFLRMM